MGRINPTDVTELPIEEVRQLPPGYYMITKEQAKQLGWDPRRWAASTLARGNSTFALAKPGSSLKMDIPSSGNPETSVESAESTSTSRSSGWPSSIPGAPILQPTKTVGLTAPSSRKGSSMPEPTGTTRPHKYCSTCGSDLTIDPNSGGMVVCNTCSQPQGQCRCRQSLALRQILVLEDIADQLRTINNYGLTTRQSQ